MLDYQQYLHVVQTEDEYDAYLDSSNFKTPNVSYILDSSEVYFSEEIQLYSKVVYNNGIIKYIDSSILDDNHVTDKPNIDKLRIGNMVNNISNWEFATFPIKKINFAEGFTMTTLPADCFRQTSISTVTIPPSVANINGSCFSNCSLLKTVTIKNDKIMIPSFGTGSSGTGSYATFSNIAANAVLYVPSNLVSTYKADATYIEIFTGGIKAIGS